MMFEASNHSHEMIFFNIINSEGQTVNLINSLRADERVDITQDKTNKTFLLYDNSNETQQNPKEPKDPKDPKEPKDFKLLIRTSFKLENLFWAVARDVKFPKTVGYVSRNTSDNTSDSRSSFMISDLCNKIVGCSSGNYDDDDGYDVVDGLTVYNQNNTSSIIASSTNASIVQGKDTGKIIETEERTMTVEGETQINLRFKFSEMSYEELLYKTWIPDINKLKELKIFPASPCNICRDKDFDLYMAYCGHSICDSCSGRINNKCPLCRSDIISFFKRSELENNTKTNQVC
ncbi:hypothetical protein B4U79_16716 [Dinothrombium tinctorium]|uniref:RING-type domain-containing protein n=1 Tax=Dinothrombium tinctorium TaxID=1965070 RepID=A0A3S3RIP8_9ACAR|nr:hypothetical protein B4U79_16941 [Dinothrombium tinctorium]RWS00251.1 hypothetical protein B4U79_16907 [Dinothrombium tinctorium]RWS01337.1 hypothetical protein B4U79_16741 [Dinothrombium tinctorium]RWS01555.1 hypothetical protein B4U79_16716 [Dinothrombium tinctorium]